MVATILILAANPEGTGALGLGHEIRTIRGRLERSQYRSRFHLEVRLAARIQDLRQAVLQFRPAVVHICAHANLNRELLFDSDSGFPRYVEAQALADFFSNFSDEVRCVLFNVCHSEKHANAVAEYIDFVVGVNGPIEEQAAIEYAAAFYEGLGAGESLLVAHRLGRNAISMSELVGHSAPVLRSKEGTRGFLFSSDLSSVESATPLLTSYFCQAPRPAADFIYREELDRMIAQILNGAESLQVFALTTALRGAGGFGKTTMAKALCWNPRIQEAYPDGIIWTVLGEKPSEAERIRAIREALKGWMGEEVPTFETARGAGLFLQRSLANKRVLVVVDDVWRREDLRPFEDLGSGSVLLITTRVRDALPVGSQFIDIDEMAAEESISLLTYGLDGQALRGYFSTLSERLGRWPLLLKLVNAQLRKLIAAGVELAEALRKIEGSLLKRGLTAFDRKNERERERAVALTMEVGFEADIFFAEDRDRYLSLSVFPEDVEIPASITALFWGVAEEEAEEIFERFYDTSLVLKFDFGKGSVRLHDVFRKYLLELTRDTRAFLHRDFLEACLPKSGRWADLPSGESYLWHHLAFHLKEAGQGVVLDSLLVEPSYLMPKLRRTDVNALLADFEGRGECRFLIADALRKSADCLERDPFQLPSQLIGRLAEGKSLLLREFVAKLRQEPGLSPLRGSLTPAGDPLRQRLQGHSGYIRDVCSLADGRIVSASSDATLKIWHSETGQCLNTLYGHTGSVAVVATLPGWRLISGADDDSLRVWDATDGSCLQVLAGHSDWIRAVCVVEKGHIVSASDDSTLRVWDLNNGRCLRILNGHAGSIHAVQALPGGRIVSASEDGCLRLWDLDSGRCIHVFEGHSGPVLALAVLSNGLIVSGSADQTLRVWELESRSCLQAFRGHERLVGAVAALDEKSFVSGSDDQTLRVWDVDSGCCVRTLVGHTGWVRFVAVLPGRTVVSASTDSTVRVWNPGVERCVQTLGGHTGRVYSLSTLSNSGIVSASDDSILRVWKLDSTHSLLDTQESHTDYVYSVRVLDSGSIVSASQDQTLRIWDGVKGDCTRIMEGHIGPVVAVTEIPDCKIVSASYDSTLRVWDPQSGDCLKVLEGHTAEICDVVSLPFGRVVSASFDGTLRIWSTATGDCLHALEGHTGRVVAAAILPGERAISASEDSTLRVWDTERGICLHILEGCTGTMVTMATLPDGRVVSEAADMTIRVWDSVSGDCLKVLDGHESRIRALLPLEDGRIISASDDSTLRVWDINSGLCLRTLEGHADAVFSISVLPGGRLVSGSSDSTIRLWDLETQTVESFSADSSVHSIAALRSSEAFVAGEVSGRIHFFHLEKLSRI